MDYAACKRKDTGKYIIKSKLVRVVSGTGVESGSVILAVFIQQRNDYAVADFACLHAIAENYIRDCNSLGGAFFWYVA